MFDYVWTWIMHSPQTVAHGQEHVRLPCPSLSSRVCSNSCPLSQWCHSTISSSVAPFSSRPQSFPAPGSFLMSQVAKVLELQLQHQSFQWIFTAGFLQDWQVWSPCCPRDFHESSLAPQFKIINSSALSFLYSPTLIHPWLLEKP